MYEILLFLCVIFSNLDRVCLSCSLSQIIVKKHTDRSGFYEDVLWDPKNFKGANKLSIQDQDFPEICANAFSGTKVATIYFFGNNIGEVKPGAFANVSGIFDIYLMKSGLKEIKRGVFNGLGIEILDIRRNEIKNIDGEAFDKMPNLGLLVLSENKLTKINSQWFRGSPKLYWVNLDKNSIETLPEGAVSFPTIREKSLSLNLNDNLLRKIEPKAFQNFTMNWLYLRRNQLTSIPENMFLNVKNVKGLDVSRNSIKCLEDRVLDTLKVVQRIFITDILGHCFENMKEWGRKNEVVIEINIEL